MATTILEPLTIASTETEEAVGTIFGLESRSVPMFLPGGAINPEYEK